MPGLNSLLIVTGSCAVAVPLGTLLAVLLLRTNLPGRRLLFPLFLFSLFVPLYLQAAGWDAGFGRMGWQGAAGEDDWLAGRRAVVWIHGLAALPWVVLIVGAALRTVDPAAEEAALLSGSRWQVLGAITLRRVQGAVLLATVWTALTVAVESSIADIYAVTTFARRIFVWASGLAPRLDASTLLLGIGILMLLVVAGLLLLMRIAPHEYVTPVRSAPRFVLRRSRLWALLLVLVVAAAAVGVPTANLVYQAGESTYAEGDQFVRTWSLGYFWQTMKTSTANFASEMRWTAVIGATAATLAALVGVPLAWLARRGGLLCAPAIAITAVCLAIPGPLVAQAIIWLLNRDDVELLQRAYDYTILAPSLAAAVRSLPVTTVVMWLAFASLSDEQLEVAELDGAGPLRRLLQIALGQRFFPLATAWWMSFAVASSDVAASILVTPPGIDTVAVRVFGLLHSGVDEQVAGLCLLSGVGYLGVGSVIYHCARRWIGENGN